MFVTPQTFHISLCKSVGFFSLCISSQSVDYQRVWTSLWNWPVCGIGLSVDLASLWIWPVCGFGQSVGYIRLRNVGWLVLAMIQGQSTPCYGWANLSFNPLGLIILVCVNNRKLLGFTKEVPPIHLTTNYIWYPNRQTFWHQRGNYI